MGALAKLHCVWYEMSHQQAASPSVMQRIQMLNSWLSMSDLVERVGANVRESIEATTSMSTIQMLQLHGPHLLGELRLASQVAVVLHPVLRRDLWSDHLLFSGTEVSGIIDYGALRVDEPAADLARLLGSLHPFDVEVRSKAVQSYNVTAMSPS